MVRSILLVALGACSYGLLSTFVKKAYAQGFPVGHVVGSQLLFGAVILAVLAAFFGRGRGGARPRQLLPLLAMGVPIGLTGVLYYSALQYIGAALAVVLLFQFTWMGVVAESILDRRMPGPAKLVSLLFLAGGTLVASGFLETGAGPMDPRGVVLGLLSAVSYTGFIVGSGRVEARVNPWLRSAVMGLGSAILAVAIFPPVFVIDGSLASGLLKWGILLALFGPVIPTLTFNTGVPKIGAGLASILGALELPTAVLMSTLALGEHVSPLQWIGVAVILAGIVAPELHARRRAPAAI